MKRRGFTLVELMGVLLIIGLIALIIIPIISSMIQDQKNKQYQQQIKNIESAAKNFGSDNLIILPTEDDEFLYITLGQLKMMGYMDKSVLNPKNNKQFSDCVKIKITKLKNNYDYEYQQDSERIESCLLESEDIIISSPSHQYIKENSNASYLIVINNKNEDNLLNTYTIDKDKIFLTGNTDSKITVVEGNDIIKVIVKGGKKEGKLSLKLESKAILKNELDDLIGENGIESKDKIIVDNTAPTITFGTNGNNNWSREVSSKITVTDSSSGGDETSYKHIYTKASEIPNKEFVNENTYTLNGVTGEYRLVAYACDNAGNCKTEKSNIFKLDNTSPTIPIITLSDGYKNNTWTKNNVTMTYNSTDIGVGDIYYQYSHNNSNYFSSNINNEFDSAKNSWSIKWTSHYIYYIRACDSLNNCSDSSSVTIKIDQTKPTIENVSVNECNNNKRTIKVTSKDSNNGSDIINVSETGSGIAGYAVTTTNVVPLLSSFNDITSTTWTSSSYSSGTYYVWVKDKVGNISESYKVLIDGCESMKNYCNLYDENGKSSDFFGTYQGSITGNYQGSVNTKYCSNSNLTCEIKSASNRVCATELCKEYGVYGWTATEINETYGCNYSRYWCNC